VTPVAVAPYGSWRSPITAELVASGGVRLGQIALDGDDVYWLELRPTEAGRAVLVRRTPDGGTEDVTPPEFSARSRVHEYGGGSFAVSGGTVVFANLTDGALYRQDRVVGPGRAAPRWSAPRPLTPIAPDAGVRHADIVVDRKRDRVICVREDHTTDAPEAANTIIAVPLEPGNREPGTSTALVTGSDFYSNPRLSPDGGRLAWLSWNHPNMPWDGCELWVGELGANGSVERAVLVAGGTDESIFGPSWSPDGILHFVSDRTGRWNLHRWNERAGVVEPLAPMEAEFGQPTWVFGLSTYAFLDAARILCTYTRAGTWDLAVLDLRAGGLTPVPLPYTEYTQVRARPGAGSAVFLAASPTHDRRVVELDVTTGEHRTLRRASGTDVDERFLSQPESIEFPTAGGLSAYALFYPPRNPDFAPPPGERPPLLVKSHGGPTDAASTGLDLDLQYWTSRGFAVVDVNYGGSSGYGREFRRRLEGHWGIVDVDDCVNAARHLADRGLVDPERLAIEGGSAGGFTTLAALTFRDVFHAGASYYGIGDLAALARDTHKFESRYLDGLVGPWPEAEAVYRERSPIHHVERLSCPVIIFQGLDDRVVPPNQAELMASALRARGLPVAYLAFEGEGHGFKRAETLQRCLEAELTFFGRLFGFDPADELPPLEIENLQARG
jgi:dipeptidyl aminopeptidase/acylaminoacyl peptidase